MSAGLIDTEPWAPVFYFCGAVKILEHTLKLMCHCKFLHRARSGESRIWAGGGGNLHLGANFNPAFITCKYEKCLRHKLEG